MREVGRNFPEQDHLVLPCIKSQAPMQSLGHVFADGSLQTPKAIHPPPSTAAVTGNMHTLPSLALEDIHGDPNTFTPVARLLS